MEEMLRNYELTCILPPHFEEADLDNFKKEIEKTIAGIDGTIIFKESGKKSLAYPINKQKQGIFLCGQISISPEKVNNLSKELKLNKQILRHLINQLPSPAVRGTGEGRFARKKRERKLKPMIKQEKTVSAKKEREKDKLQLEEIDKKLDELVDI